MKINCEQSPCHTACVSRIIKAIVCVCLELRFRMRRIKYPIEIVVFVLKIFKLFSMKGGSDWHFVS